MKTLVKKINTAVTLSAVFLLATVGLSAQTYQDDVYYSPSENTSNKKAEQPAKDVTKKVKRTYRANDKVEDFSAAQKKYAKMLSQKEKESDYAETYDKTESWVHNTQGLTHKDDIQKEVSLYNKGNVNANAPDENAYYEEDEYVLWQPVKVTRVYTQPRWYSDFYFGFNFDWGNVYYCPYYADYYNPYYWDDYYYPHWRGYYYSHYYSPYYRWHRPYWRYHHYGYSPYYSNYYNPYYGYDDYYNDRYYRNNYSYRQRPREYSSRSTSNYRRNSVATQRRGTVNSADVQRARAENMNHRYSSNAYRRGSASSTNNGLRRGRTNSTTYNSRATSSRRSASGARKVAPKIAHRKANDIMYQRENPYTRRIENTGNTYRSRATTTSKHSTQNNRQTYRNNRSQNYRRTINNTSTRRSTPTIYRKTSTPSRTNSSGTYRRSTPNRSNNNSYRRSATPSRSNSSSYRRSTSTSTRTKHSYQRSTPKRSTYNSSSSSSSSRRSTHSTPSRSSSPSRSNNSTRYRR